MRVRKALLIRPGDDGWAPELRFDPPFSGRDVLPVPLVALASAIKFASPHRVSMHDATRGEDPARALTVHRADAVLIAWHPAARETARRLAGAARETAKAVLAVVQSADHAALVDDALFQGALHIRNPAALLAVMDALGENRGDAGVAEALETPPGPGAPATLDRKLLDYARYQGSEGARWRGAVRAFRPVGNLSGSPFSDKGRFAGSTVPLGGDVPDVERIVRDVNECALLGIPWLDLRRTDDAAPPPALWTELLPRLARLRENTPGLDPDLGGLRLRVDPEHLGDLDVDAARAAGVAAIDLGLLDAAVAPAAMTAPLRAREAGWVATAEFLLGGPDADADARALLDLEEVGVAIQARVPADLGSAVPGDPASLDAALASLRAPNARREALRRLARDVDTRADAAARLVRPRRPSVRALVRRLLRG